MDRAPFFAAWVNLPFMGTGSPAFFGFENIVNGRPEITPSELPVSNWKKWGWMLIFEDWKLVKSSSSHSLVRMVSTQSYTLARRTAGYLRSSLALVNRSS